MDYKGSQNIVVEEMNSGADDEQELTDRGISTNRDTLKNIEDKARLLSAQRSTEIIDSMRGAIPHSRTEEIIQRENEVS